MFFHAAALWYSSAWKVFYYTLLLSRVSLLVIFIQLFWSCFQDWVAWYNYISGNTDSGQFWKDVLLGQWKISGLNTLQAGWSIKKMDQKSILLALVNSCHCHSAQTSASTANFSGNHVVYYSWTLRRGLNGHGGRISGQVWMKTPLEILDMKDTRNLNFKTESKPHLDWRF